MCEEFKNKVFEVEIEYDPKTGGILAEFWKNESGLFDRLADLPPVTKYCPLTGKPIYRRWHQDEFALGPHRDGDKPARVTTAPNTGINTQEDFMKGGRYHRGGDKPAEISRREDGTPEKHGYWQLGKRHRQPDDGPAVIRFDAEGNISEVEYWFFDRQIPYQPPTSAYDMDI